MKVKQIYSSQQIKQILRKNLEKTHAKRNFPYENYLKDWSEISRKHFSIDAVHDSDFINLRKIAEKGDFINIPSLSEGVKIKDFFCLRKDQIIKEIKQNFGVNVTKSSPLAKLQILLLDYRALQFTKSNLRKPIDYHIGLFSQGKLNNCAFLATVRNQTDETLKKVISHEKDGNYSVIFPGDKEKTKIIITPDELKNRKVLAKDGIVLDKFAAGDKDIILLEMAYVKRFGAKGFLEAVDTIDIKNLFSAPGKQTAKDIRRIRRQDLKNPSEGIVSNLRNYKKAIINKSKNIEIINWHAYSVIGVDKKANMIKLSNPYNSNSEIDVPFKVFAKYFLITK